MSATAASADEVLGINDKVQLAEAEAILRRRINTAPMVSGVNLADPKRFDGRSTLRCRRDVCIDANAIIEGEVVLDDGVQVGPFTLIRDATIGAGTVIHSHCVIEQSLIGAACDIGPWRACGPRCSSPTVPASTAPSAVTVSSSAQAWNSSHRSNSAPGPRLVRAPPLPSQRLPISSHLSAHGRPPFRTGSTRPKGPGLRSVFRHDSSRLAWPRHLGFPSSRSGQATA